MPKQANCKSANHVGFLIREGLVWMLDISMILFCVILWNILAEEVLLLIEVSNYQKIDSLKEGNRLLLKMLYPETIDGSFLGKVCKYRASMSSAFAGCRIWYNVVLSEKRESTTHEIYRAWFPRSQFLFRSQWYLNSGKVTRQKLSIFCSTPELSTLLETNEETIAACIEDGIWSSKEYAIVATDLRDLERVESALQAVEFDSKFAFIIRRSMEHVF